jgi:thiaminase/transcriptional activator TenA
VAPFRSAEDDGAGQALWSLEAWRAAAPILEKILAHPFIAGLLDGSLPRDVFTFYICQDSLYLDDFARILSAASLKAPGPQEAKFLCEAALEAGAVEGALHGSYLKGQDRPPAPSPSCLLYTSFLYRHFARSPFSVLMASLLPCFWIYLAVGRHMLSLSADSRGNPYRDWINTYGGEDYARSVDRAVRICDRLAAAESPQGREDMLQAFLAASRMEWMFWDSAYRKEAWPV